MAKHNLHIVKVSTPQTWGIVAERNHNNRCTMHLLPERYPNMLEAMDDKRSNLFTIRVKDSIRAGKTVILTESELARMIAQTPHGLAEVSGK